MPSGGEHARRNGTFASEFVSLEVIRRSDKSRAFDGGSGREVSEQRCIMIGAELVVPVLVARIDVPDER
jgi:hypothetical protein